jgi:hypothetical protein
MTKIELLSAKSVKKRKVRQSSKLTHFYTDFGSSV